MIPFTRSDREAAHPTPVVGVLIVDDQRRMLLLKSSGRFGDRWVVPTGHVVRNESLLDALRREVRKETNLELDRVRFLGLRENMSMFSHNLMIEYGALAATTDVVHGVEFSAFGWFTRPEVSTLALADFTRDLIYEHSFACFEMVQPKGGPTPGAKMRIG